MRVMRDAMLGCSAKRRTFVSLSVGLDGVRNRGPDEMTLKFRQVAEKCGRLPLALNMAGRLASEDPLSPTCWRLVLDRLRDKENKFRKEKIVENGGCLFPVLDLTFSRLPEKQREQFKLMAVVAPGVPVATEMMANLWDAVRARLCDQTTVVASTINLHTVKVICGTRIFV